MAAVEPWIYFQACRSFYQSDPNSVVTYRAVEKAAESIWILDDLPAAAVDQSLLNKIRAAVK